ncbi:MAG: hypothetical protein ACRCXT_08180 [Paraclostridium sp.]
MHIDFKIIAIIMMFVILISIQYTLNKIYRVLIEIKNGLYNQRLRDEKYD